MPVVDDCRLTSKFGKRNISYGPNDHWGLDFGGPSAGQSVYVKAAAAGRVRFIGPVKYRSDPRNIGIEHPDGSLTLYAHTRNQKVRVGQQVERGEIIAETWHTGIRLEAGIHLHFEWWRDANDHTSVFDPTKRLADYGWVFKWDAKAQKYRLHDEWEGRSAKSAAPAVTITHSSSPAPASKPAPAPNPLEGLMAKLDDEDKKYIEGQFEALYNKIAKPSGISWLAWHQIGYDGATVREMANKGVAGAQGAYQRIVKHDAGQDAILKAVADAAAKGSGLSAEQITEIAQAASEGAERGAQAGLAEGLTAEITVKPTGA